MTERLVVGETEVSGGVTEVDGAVDLLEEDFTTDEVFLVVAEVEVVDACCPVGLEADEEEPREEDRATEGEGDTFEETGRSLEGSDVPEELETGGEPEVELKSETGIEELLGIGYGGREMEVEFA